MARIVRKTQKIFASSASNNGQFGSLAAGTKLLSSDPAVLQSLPAFLTGWLDAVIGTKDFPALEEFQALDYINTYQLSYIFQEGIPEYDSGTIYFQNSIVKKAGTYQLYGSRTDNNTGHALTDGTNWLFLIDLTASIANATETQAGIARIATAAEVAAGTDDTTIVSPFHLSQYLPVTGDGKENWTSLLQAGWIWADGKTIGDASSNATSRANADTLNLFTAFWRDYTDAELPLYNFNGSLAARGVSAAADFAANKAVTIIDKRGRVSAARDNLGGTPAGRLTGQPFGVDGTHIGNAGGEESHVLNIPEMPAHNHSVPLQTAKTQETNHGNDVQLPDPAGGVVTGVTGGTTGHNNVQPTIICNYMIKL